MPHPFPVQVHRKTLQYKRNGSDKEYHLLLITNSSHQAIYVQRYGKTGTWGQMDAFYGDQSHHLKSFHRKFHEKINKGYEQTRGDTIDCRDIWDLHEAIKAYWPKIAHQIVEMFGLEQFDLVRSTSGVTLNANMSGPEPARPALEVERYKGNPRWGAF